MADLDSVLGKFVQCPVCKHTSYYPFSDGMMCIKCEHTGPLLEGSEPTIPYDERPEAQMSKNQRRKHNKKLREAADRVTSDPVSAERDDSSSETSGESTDGLDA